MAGTWQVDVSTFEADHENQPPPQGMQVYCEVVNEQNGVYCEASMPDESGKRQIVSSELLAYNQSTDKIQMMLFNGQVVSYGSGTFTDNVLNYTDTDVNGKPFYDGELHIEDNTLTQVIHVPVEAGGRMQVTFNKTN